MSYQALKQNYIKGLLETKAILIKSINETPFTKRNGEKSYMFFDHTRLATSPRAYKAFIDTIQYLVQKAYPDGNFVFCNVDSKISAQMVGSLAYKLEKPQIIYKSEALTSVEKGTNKRMNGNSDWNMSVALLDDVMTGGDGTAKKVGDLILSSFPKIKDVQIFVGFIRHPKPSTYKTHYILTRDELLDIVWNSLTKEQKEAVEIERKSNDI